MVYAGRSEVSEYTKLPDAEYLPARSVAERVARGVTARQGTPLESHAQLQVSAHRSNPVDTLERQAVSRDPELVPIRHGRMLMSPFAFFRGGAAIMAADLAGTPSTGIRAQLCGDAHLLNFGMFETAERKLIFGLNDFDETLPGPFEWDVKRLAASVEIAGRDMGMKRKHRSEAVQATVRGYRLGLIEFAAMRNIDVWYARLPAKRLLRQLSKASDAKTGYHVRKRIDRALTRNHLRAFDRLLCTVDGQIQFVSKPPTLVPIEELLDQHQRERYVGVIRSFLHQYRESLRPDRRSLLESYRFVHIARKVVGVGSVGTRAWVVLLMGRDEHDPLFLQLKEAQRSVLAPYAGPTLYETNGRRVVEGQHLMQAAGDSMLGWYQLKALDDRIHDFYVRQLWDGKASIEVADLTRAGLRAYGEVCGWTLARGHARSGDRIALASYLGEGDEFERAIATFAVEYADLNESDYSLFQAAVESGRIDAVIGV